MEVPFRFCECGCPIVCHTLHLFSNGSQIAQCDKHEIHRLKVTDEIRMMELVIDL